MQQLTKRYTEQVAALEALKVHRDGPVDHQADALTSSLKSSEDTLASTLEHSTARANELDAELASIKDAAAVVAEAAAAEKLERRRGGLVCIVGFQLG